MLRCGVPPALAFRRTLIHSAATIAVAGSLVAGFAATSDPATLFREPPPVSQGPRQVSVEVSLVAAVVEKPSTIGVADSTLYTLSGDDLERQLSLLKDAGVTDLRIAVPWVYIQAGGPDSYDWSKMDAVVNTAHDMGFTVTATLTGNPAWDGVPIAGAPDPDAYATFAGATAERYRGKISAYEVWNEPNGVLFYAPVDPESYTRVLRAAYPAIKAADPDATVIGGVLGPVQTVPGVTMAPDEFLRRMYAAGAQGSFDALSYHPYHYTLPFSQGGADYHSPLNQMGRLRALMIENGDGELLIWATEYGTPTTPLFGLSDAQQAAFLHDFIATWQTVDGAGPAFIYTARDLDTGSWDSEGNFGLYRTDWTAKPSLTTLSQILGQLEAGTFDPGFRTAGLPTHQMLFIQLSSTVLALVNTALIIPRAIGSAITELTTQVITALADAARGAIACLTGTAAPVPAAAVATTGFTASGFAASGFTALGFDTPDDTTPDDGAPGHEAQFTASTDGVPPATDAPMSRAAETTDPITPAAPTPELSVPAPPAAAPESGGDTTAQTVGHPGTAATPSTPLEDSTAAPDAVSLDAASPDGEGPEGS